MKNIKKKHIVCGVIGLILVVGIILGIVYGYPYYQKNVTYNQAMEMYNNQQFEEAKEIFESVQGFKYADEWVTKCKYSYANQLFDAGDYEHSYTAFDELGDYEDARARKDNSKYMNAKRLYVQGDYKAAADIFEEMGDYEDAVQQKKVCQYQNAVNYMNNQQYEEAIQWFEKTEGYEDSADRITSCKYQIAKQNYKNKNYADAKKQFAEISGYSDADKYYEKSAMKLKYEKTKFKKCCFDNAEDIERLLGEHYYGVWYDGDNDNQVIIDKYERDGREYGIKCVSMPDGDYLYEVKYFYLDKPDEIMREYMFYDEYYAEYGFDLYQIDQYLDGGNKALFNCDTATRNQNIDRIAAEEAEMQRQQNEQLKSNIYNSSKSEFKTKRWEVLGAEQMYLNYTFPSLDMVQFQCNGSTAQISYIASEQNAFDFWGANTRRLSVTAQYSVNGSSYSMDWMEIN